MIEEEAAGVIIEREWRVNNRLLLNNRGRDRMLRVNFDSVVGLDSVLIMFKLIADCCFENQIEIMQTIMH